VCKYIYI